MTPDEKPIPLWSKLTAVGIYVALVLVIVLARDRLHADLWPLDASRVAPNILASVIQAAVLFPVAVLIWPPTRRRIHRFMDSKLKALEAHQAEHNTWVHQTLHRMHVEVTGEAPAAHPHFADPGATSGGPVDIRAPKRDDKHGTSANPAS